MKSHALISALFLMLFMVSCCPKGKDQTGKPNTPVQSAGTGITLNGLNTTEAGDRVCALAEDNSSSDSTTSVWLSKNWVDTVSQLLKKEGGDGFRIYFAKKDSLNSIVIVSTKKNPVSDCCSSVSDHADYFDHQSSFLTGLEHSGKDYTESHLLDSGTRLYEPQSPCVKGSVCSITQYNHEISCNEAYRYVHLQNKGKKKLKPINTISEWFPSGMLEALSLELDSARKSKDETKTADGIRIYFAKANKAATENKRKYIFIFTTTKLVGPYHEDYFQCHGNFYTKGLKDHGEECPIHCNLTSWQQ